MEVRKANCRCVPKTEHVLHPKPRKSVSFSPEVVDVPVKLGKTRSGKPMNKSTSVVGKRTSKSSLGSLSQPPNRPKPSRFGGHHAKTSWRFKPVQ